LTHPQPQQAIAQCCLRCWFGPLWYDATRKNTVNAPNQTTYRILVTKVGLDGHDWDSRIVAAYLRGWGIV